ncbi:MAG: MFS transporter [Candidatus Eremiobacterota bacterium]
MKEHIITDKNIQTWLVISVSFSAFITLLDDYILSISLPTISSYFNVSTGTVTWLILTYLLIMSSTLLIFGKLGDKIGLKKIFITGYIFFTAGSLLCGISINIYMLILSRVIQGLGGAMLFVTGFAIMSKFLPPNIMGWAFSMISAFSAAGVTIGSPLGGFITAWLNWRWIFFVNVPVCLIAIIISWKVIPDEGKKISSDFLSDFDILGAFLSFLSPFLLLYGLNRGGEAGWTSFTIIACLVASVILFIIFILWEKRVKEPLMDLAIFKIKSFSSANISTFLAVMSRSGHMILIPFYMQLIKGLTPEKAGAVLIVFSCVYTVSSLISGRLADRVNPFYLYSSAMILAGASCITFCFTIDSPGLLNLFVFLIWFAVALGMFMSPNNKYVMSLIPPEKKGSASGIFNTVSSMALVMGVCILEAVFSSSLPENISSASLSVAKIPSHILLRGFFNAYLLAGFFCFSSGIISVIRGSSRSAFNK